jgi:hypothetical protein
MDSPIAAIFDSCAREEFHGSSPLYERLAIAIANDPELLALAAGGRKGERIPNLFFAAVHYCLLTGISHPVSRFYGSLGGFYDGNEDPYPDFRSFCREHAERIRGLIAVRRVQTNEVSRCAGLVPAFASVARRVSDQALFLVDIGASAGLNLFWDLYGYAYGTEIQCGDSNSPVQIHCNLRGKSAPPLPASFPQVVGRIGLDLHPLDVGNAEDALWLRALVWPGQEARADLLRSAVEFVRQRQLTLRAGNGVDSLPDIMGAVPGGAVLFIVRMFTQLAPADRNRLSRLISNYGRRQDVVVVSFRPHGKDDSEIRLTSFFKGENHEEPLAYFQNHGAWIEWLGEDHSGSAAQLF